jgi:hypothetical protein
VKVVVGTVTPVLLPVAEPSSTVTIQNLGTGVVYVDGDSGVTTGTGMKIPVGTSLTISGPDSLGSLYLISDIAATDVRYLA